MRRLLLIGCLISATYSLSAQELYVSTEPASNMPKNSIGLRLGSEIMSGSNANARFMPELMYGLSKDLMVHGSVYISDIHQRNQRVEGYGFYAKYRFLSIDTIQRHFRAAAYARYSSINNPHSSHGRPIDEINLEGDNSGVQGGIVATQLLHKLALSASVSYIHGFENRGGFKLGPDQANSSIGYTFSTGYLTFPKTYTSYRQPNINLYLEFLGQSNIGRNKNFLEAAPALQLILNSRTRLDISKRFQLYGNMTRMTKNMLLLRIEHNIFNAF